MRFKKTLFTTDSDIKEKEREMAERLKSLLPSNYQFLSSSSSNANGESIYLKVLRDGESCPFVFRISDHVNSNKNQLISSTGYKHEMNGFNVDEMRVFYGEMTRERVFTEFYEDVVEGKYDTFKGVKPFETRLTKKGTTLNRFKIKRGVPLSLNIIYKEI